MREKIDSFHPSLPDTTVETNRFHIAGGLATLLEGASLALDIQKYLKFEESIMFFFSSV